MSPRRRLYCVIGCHRSGTSATAGALAHCGVDFGDNLMPPSPANPRGYFEDVRIVALHDRLLSSMGYSWDRPPEGCMVGNTLAFRRALAQVRLWLSERIGNEAGVKDPRMCFFPGLWETAARQEGWELRPITVTRPGPAIISSLVDREGWTRARACQLMVRYHQACRQWNGQAVVWYEHLLANPEEELRRVFGQPWRTITVGEFLDPELNHHA